MAVRVEEDTGAGFQTVTTAAPRADGTWSAQVRPAKTAQIRAAVGPDLSETRQILVTNRTVRVRVARGHLFVTVTPAAPYARIALQFWLRERFGWWAVSERRLDYVSEATFRVRGRGRVRAGPRSRSAPSCVFSAADPGPVRCPVRQPGERWPMISR
jgi:hypothetical protein